MAQSIVISQSMYFPWVGFLEQMRLADVFVRYDDVQFSKGSFTNRVQIKTPNGVQWMSVPLQKHVLNQKIKDVRIDESKDWRAHHLSLLRNAYHKAPFYRDLMDLVRLTFSQKFNSIGDLAYLSQMSLFDYFSINHRLSIQNIEDMQISGFGSQRVKDIVAYLAGNQYITGHGPSKYLDHLAMENAGIEVRYMRYEKHPYPQLYGEFTPYVSALDLVANCGKSGLQFIKSSTINWKDFHESP